MPAAGFHKIYDPQVKSLQVVVNQNWQSLPVMKLNSADRLNIGFDELSHDYHRYICHIERCEYDWKTATEVFESDWLNGFNDLIIDDYEHSINTTVPYTHYHFSLPNEQCKLTMSGNYRLHIIEDGADEDVLTVEFMVTEQSMQLAMSASTNTDIDLNQSHQQVTMALSFLNKRITHPEEQLRIVLMQNGREDNCRRNVRPSFVNQNGVEWSHTTRAMSTASTRSSTPATPRWASTTSAGTVRTTRYSPSRTSPARTTSTTRMPTAPSSSATATTFRWRPPATTCG